MSNLYITFITQIKNMNIQNSLKKLGLGEKESLIYAYCIEKEFATITDISRSINIARTSLYSPINSLIKKGLLKEITKKKRRFLKAVSIEILENDLEESLSFIKEKKIF